LAARDHCFDMVDSMGHQGTDGSNFWDRTARYTDTKAAGAENISYGTEISEDVDHQYDILLQLYVDDGVSDRGHRNNMMDGDYKSGAVASCDHGAYKTQSVFLYSSADPVVVNSAGLEKISDMTDSSGEATTDGNADGNTDVPTDGNADGNTDVPTDGNADGNTDAPTDGNADGNTDVPTDGNADGNTDAPTDGNADGNTDVPDQGN